MKNPIRRSKKIGLTQGGRVKCGVPSEKRSRVFTRSTCQMLSEHDGKTLIIRENPSKHHFHPATRSEVEEVLKRLPAKETKYVRAVILRRIPKTDEQMDIEARRQMGCVILNAFSKDMSMTWPTKPARSTIKHMAYWCDNWRQEGEAWILRWTYEEIKKYYLYHLLLHEIGHINEPHYHALKRRESFAEDYALHWARELGAI